MERTLLLAWIGVFCAPLLGVGVFAAAGARGQGRLAWGAAAGLAVSAGLYRLGFGFVAPTADIAWALCCFVAYCVLVARCWRTGWKPLRFVVRTIALVPICVGYFLSTVGVLGLGFIVGDMTSPPFRTERMPGGLLCSVTSWGYAFSSSGYRVQLHRRWDAVPFVQREVASVSIDETDEAEPQTASCESVFASYKQSTTP